MAKCKVQEQRDTNEKANYDYRLAIFQRSELKEVEKKLSKIPNESRVMSEDLEFQIN